MANTKTPATPAPEAPKAEAPPPKAETPKPTECAPCFVRFPDGQKTCFYCKAPTRPAPK